LNTFLANALTGKSQICDLAKEWMWEGRRGLHNLSKGFKAAN